jgi:hypothetical protein
MENYTLFMNTSTPQNHLRLKAFLVGLCFLLANTSLVAQKNNPADQLIGVPAMTNVLVQWVPGSFNLDQAFVTQLNAKYSGRIQVSINAANTSSLQFRFQSGSISEVDLLQILRMEGVNDPWFARNSRRYFLTAEGTLASDIIK